MRTALTLACLLLALPVVAVLGSWTQFDAAAAATLAHQARTVMADYALQSLLLAVGVAVGVALVGVGAAVVVSLFRFPGREVFEWAMLLPLAMPAYVLAYAYTDALQFAGPVQTALRTSGHSAPSTPRALLTRSALTERAVQMMEAARLLGAGLRRRLFEVALPLARPAVMAGVALALMETLADYGVGAYFGLTTFTTGIYRAWLSMNDAVAAAQLASVLLAVIAVLLALERRAQARLRFATSRAGPQHALDAQPVQLHGALAAVAWLLCALPVALGFLLPAGWLAVMMWREALDGEFGLPWARFASWAGSSLLLASVAALAATAVSLALAFALRRREGPSDRVLAAGARVLSLGYAVPGAVVAIGILLPVGWLQQRFPGSGVGALFTGTAVGLLYAYAVRFSAVALQTVEAGYARIPVSVDETARMLGAGRARAFFTLHLPLLRRSALAAALLVFVDVMKELPATLVLRPFGTDTLAVVAYNLARDERLAEAALPSLAIVAVGLVPVLLLSRAMRR
jgi:iron(III) transport system permease protein